MNTFRKSSLFVLVAVVAVLAVGVMHSSAEAGGCHSGGYGSSYSKHCYSPSYCNYGSYNNCYSNCYYPTSCYYPATYSSCYYPTTYTSCYYPASCYYPTWSSSYPNVKPVSYNFPSTYWPTGYAP